MDKKYYRELCQRIASQEDKAAFDLLYNSYHPRLLKVAAYFLGSYTYADDVVSEVFIKFLALGKRMNKIKDPDNYFFVATKNQALTYQQKLHSKFSNDEPQLRISVSNINPENTLIEKEILEIIENTIQKFPTKRKIIFEMIKEENMSYKEVAQNLDLSIKAVEKQMTNAMKALRQALSNYYQESPSKIHGFNTYLSVLPIILSLFN